MNEDLPNGWISTTLSQIAMINPRHPKGLDDTLPVSFAPMAALSEDKPTFQYLEERPLGDVRKGFTHFAEGDVLFAKITPCMENGKGAVATHLRNGLGCGTTEVHVLRPFDGIDPHYVYRFLAQPDVRQEAKDNFTGTAGQARVPLSFIEELEIPLAPAKEQKRIVAKLESVLAKVHDCEDRLAQIPTILKRFRQSVLAAACSGRLTAAWREENDFDAEWADHKLSELGLVSGGITKNAKRHALKLQVPYLRVANVYENRLKLDQISMIGVTEQEYNRTLLAKGDILFVEGNGSLDQIGRVALWDGSIDRCVHQNHLIKFRAGHKVVPPYVLLQMMAPDVRGQLIEKATSSAGLNTLSISKISDVHLPVPSPVEQGEIVRRVEGLFSLSNRIEARFESTRAQIQMLTPSLLAKAFRGELVATEAGLAEGREFESAEALLASVQRY